MPSAEKDWEIKARTYVLQGKKPLSWTIQTKHTNKKPLMYFDEDLARNREIRYASNHNSVFVDEQEGHATLSPVVFSDGVVHVPRAQQSLQKLMSLYHPQAGKLWIELNPQKDAEDELAFIEVEIDAMNLVHSLEVADLEAIMRAEIGSSVNSMTSKEIKRDAFLLAKKDPKLFIELANDEDIKLRNLANRAVESGVVKLSDENTVFKWVKNGKKIFTVPFDQHPYYAFAQFFKTDEGVQVLKSILSKLD